MTRSGPEGSGSSRALSDRGAQPERTHQAWTRTVLALVGCALLATRLTASAGVAAVVLAASGATAALALLAVQRRRLRSGVHRPAPRSVAAMTALTVVLAGGTLALVLGGPAGR